MSALGTEAATGRRRRCAAPSGVVEVDDLLIRSSSQIGRWRSYRSHQDRTSALRDGIGCWGCCTPLLYRPRGARVIARSLWSRSPRLAIRLPSQRSHELGNRRQRHASSPSDQQLCTRWVARGTASVAAVNLSSPYQLVRIWCEPSAATGYCPPGCVSSCRDRLGRPKITAHGGAELGHGSIKPLLQLHISRVVDRGTCHEQVSGIPQDHER